MDQYEDKTRKELINELIGLRKQVAELRTEKHYKSRTQELKMLNEQLKKEIFYRKKAEEDLISFFNLSLDIFLIFDFNGNIKRYNPMFYKTLGYNQDEFIVKTVMDIVDKYVHPEDIECTKAAIRDNCNGKPYINVINRYRSKDGTYKWFAWTDMPIVEKNLVFAVARDITELKRSKEALFNQFKQMSTVCDSLNALIYVSDIQTHELLFINKYGLDIFGTDIIGKPCYQVLQTNKTKPCSFCTNQKITLDDLPHIWEFKNTLTNRWYQCIDRAITWIDGRLVRIEIAVDITERKQIEEELRLSKEWLTKIFHATPAPLSITKLINGQIVDSNKAFLNMIEQNYEDVIGKNITVTGLWDDLEQRANVVDIVLKKGAVYNEEVTLRTVSGELRNALYSAVTINMDGILYLLSIYNDITEKKKFEKEIDRLERLNRICEMAAGIAHEIRNPMTTVRGLLQVLKNKKENIENEEHYKIMIQELDHANSIITEFLSIARNNVNSLELGNLNSLIKTMYPLIKVNAMNSGMNIRIKFGNIPDLLLNEKEIRQLLLNLVRNGFESMNSGKCLKIRTFIEGKDVVLAVKDQGKGIEPEVLKKLGTPFFTTKPEGTGLGMASCYSIASRHNATIDVETGSTGTTFYVRFRTNEPDL